MGSVVYRKSGFWGRLKGKKYSGKNTNYKSMSLRKARRKKLTKF